MRGCVARLTIALVGLLLVAASGRSEAQLDPNSRWPMHGHDLHHTGQSDMLGPLFQGTAPAANQVRSLTFYDKVKGFPVVGPDGAVYVGAGWKLCAINPLDVSDPTNPVMTVKWPDNTALGVLGGCVQLNADVTSV